MLIISSNIVIPEAELEFIAIRAQGAGGQNINKVSSAIHLRFDINASTLPDILKQRLLEIKDQRISKDGTVIIKAQRFRTQEKNRQDALDRLLELVQKANTVQKIRRPTKITKGVKKKRVDNKTHRGKIKALRTISKQNGFES